MKKEWKGYSSGQEKSSAIGGGIIGETNSDPISGQFVCISGAHNDVPLYLGVSDLTDYVFVGEADNHSILRCIVFIPVLYYETLSRVVIGFTLF